MSLVKPTLESGIKSALEPLFSNHTNKAFYDAMEKFIEVSSKQQGNTGVDVFNDANTQAAKVFSEEMMLLADDIAKVISDQVDTYIKSATIIVPSGQAVATTGTAAAQAGATVNSSPPAEIS